MKARVNVLKIKGRGIGYKLGSNQLLSDSNWSSVINEILSNNVIEARYATWFEDKLPCENKFILY